MRYGLLAVIVFATLVCVAVGNPNQIMLLFTKIKELQNQIDVIFLKIANLENSCALRS